MIQSKEVSKLVELHHHSTLTCMVCRGLKLKFVVFSFLSICVWVFAHRLAKDKKINFPF